jgi:hypothetical protein
VPVAAVPKQKTLVTEGDPEMNNDNDELSKEPSMSEPRQITEEELHHMVAMGLVEKKTVEGEDWYRITPEGVRAAEGLLEMCDECWDRFESGEIEVTVGEDGEIGAQEASTQTPVQMLPRTHATRDDN